MADLRRERSAARARRRPGLAPLLGLIAALGCAELQGLGLPTLPGAPLDESTVAAGLRDALRVGTERASSQLSDPGGFSGNPLLRLALPPELDRIGSSLRSVGLGSQVDALESAMNRAAERAAGEAVPVFASAIRAMTVRDAFDILNGGPDAATQYFQANTADALRARFDPVVESAMHEVGVYGLYQELTARYALLPFSKPAAPDLGGYVTDQALTGLFSTLAQEEARIREDPAARTTSLLRRVFGR